MDEYPKVFISHASEDKERFVKKFALKLRNKGVDAWLDRWEIKPGDSLVDKIFEEGIGECSAFIIILSKNSVNKKWVKEELSCAVVSRIEKSTKIIPVKIDDNINIPTSINHLYRVNITNLDHYENDFEDIYNTIYNVNQKPPLGKPSKHIFHEYEVPGFNQLDSLILKATGDVVLKKNRIYIQGSEAISELSNYEISKESITESLEILESQGIIMIQKTGGKLEYYQITMNPSGFLKYAEIFVDNMDQIHKAIISCIINDDILKSDHIALEIGCKSETATSILQYYHNFGYINAPTFINGNVEVFEIKSVGRRYFREILS